MLPPWEGVDHPKSHRISTHEPPSPPSQSHVPSCTSSLLLHPREETQDSPSSSFLIPLLSGDRMKLSGGPKKLPKGTPKPECRSTEILQLIEKIFCRNFKHPRLSGFTLTPRASFDLLFHREPSQKKRHMFSLVTSCHGLYPAEAGCAP